MRFEIVLRYLGFVLIINAAFMLLAVLVSGIYGDSSLRALLYSALITMLFGVFPLVFVPAARKISNSEGLVIVVGGWLLSCLFATMPYVLWGGEFGFTNAWFESVSGFTTTGSTILTDIEVVPAGLLFWRAATHWLGGVGIVLFVLSVLPAMGSVGTILYRTEVSGLAQDSFRQNARVALRIMMTVYVGLTLVEVIALMLAGMNLFDAVTHSFATIATGGFSPKNASIAYYNSIGIEVILIIFMVLSGVHFGVLYSLFVERSGAIWRSSAVRYYISALLLVILIITIANYGGPYTSWWRSLRFSAFQAVSIGTSTGFANANSSVWPALSQLLLMFLALQCACAGSTSGGIKVDRFVMAGKAIKKQLKLLRYPHAVIRAWMDGKSVADEVLSAGVLYIILYLGIVAAGGLALAILGVDTLEAFSGVIATTGNVGPGLGAVGSVGNFAHIPAAGKWILTLTMLFGRLEIYALTMIFVPSLWRIRSGLSDD
ncbi:MAG: TrkH family potassium uptake protein [bacterium]